MPAKLFKISLLTRIFKGWSGPKSFHGEFIEGSFHAHQVPLPNAKSSSEELAALDAWLASYRPTELFHCGPNGTGEPVASILRIIPQRDDKKLGQRRESYAAYEPLHVPDWLPMGVAKDTQESCMKHVGKLLKVVIKQ
jgi:xylulose-5-phosphate/fructose-6-phosphate phosphoketolase